MSKDEVGAGSISIARRSALSLGLAAGAALIPGGAARADAKVGGAKVTALYHHPTDPADFEKHYTEVHMPMVYAVKGIKHVELAKPVAGPDGKPPAFYRVTEIWFDSMDDLKRITGSPDWDPIRKDVPKFATGGVTRLVSAVG